MIRTLKLILLGLGVCLIMASFLTGLFSGAVEPAEGKSFKDGPDFVLQEGDELVKPVEDYTGEDSKYDKKTVDNSVPVAIPQGAMGSDVADILLDEGLISDKEGFETRLVELEMDRNIVYGEYSIPKGGTLDEIIKIITCSGI
ncbi:MAG: hypothetical protein WCS98_00285 [Bacillota bacterium]|nr:hypothetical protein [Bacillota bacterium]MDD3297310.1 hypothetical protein [Bacillota bacterium]MDD3850103.1 hypothetical protein [Bacillota bacterium]MDD4706826.1 hypothetical protein [Bacillota bacterium]